MKKIILLSIMLKILYYLNNSELLEACPEGGFFPKCL